MTGKPVVRFLVRVDVDELRGGVDARPADAVGRRQVGGTDQLLPAEALPARLALAVVTQPGGVVAPDHALLDVRALGQRHELAVRRRPHRPALGASTRPLSDKQGRVETKSGLMLQQWRRVD